MFSAAMGGHRGLPKEFPGDSLAGIVAGAAVSQIVELDVRASADGFRALSHDPDISGIEVNTSVWLDIHGLDMGDRHHPALLNDVLALLPAFPLEIKIKNWLGERWSRDHHYERSQTYRHRATKR